MKVRDATQTGGLISAGVASVIALLAGIGCAPPVRLGGTLDEAQRASTEARIQAARLAETREREVARAQEVRDPELRLGDLAKMNATAIRLQELTAENTELTGENTELARRLRRAELHRRGQALNVHQRLPCQGFTLR